MNPNNHNNINFNQNNQNPQNPLNIPYMNNARFKGIIRKDNVCAHFNNGGKIELEDSGKGFGKISKNVFIGNKCDFKERAIKLGARRRCRKQKNLTRGGIKLRRRKLNNPTDMQKLDLECINIKRKDANPLAMREDQMGKLVNWLQDSITCCVCANDYSNTDEGRALMLKCSHRCCQACCRKIIETHANEFFILDEPAGTIVCPMCKGLTNIAETIPFRFCTSIPTELDVLNLISSDDFDIIGRNRDEIIIITQKIVLAAGEVFNDISSFNGYRSTINTFTNQHSEEYPEWKKTITEFSKMVVRSDTEIRNLIINEATSENRTFKEYMDTFLPEFDLSLTRGNEPGHAIIARSEKLLNKLKHLLVTIPLLTQKINIQIQYQTTILLMSVCPPYYQQSPFPFILAFKKMIRDVFFSFIFDVRKNFKNN
jgi:hypothetical protein